MAESVVYPDGVEVANCVSCDRVFVVGSEHRCAQPVASSPDPAVGGRWAEGAARTLAEEVRRPVRRLFGPRG